jgi:hypothetical protein
MGRKANNSATAPTITLGGKIIRMHPFTSQDHREFELWVRQRYIETARAMALGLPEEKRMELYQYAIDRAAQINASSPEMDAMVESVEGAAKILWFSVRKDRPDVTEADVAALLADRDTLDAMTLPPLQGARLNRSR